MPISLPRPFPCPTGSMILKQTEPLPRPFLSLGSCGDRGRWSVEAKTRKKSDSGQTLLVWRPGATLRGPQPVTVKNDTTLSWGLWGPEDAATGAKHAHRHLRRGRYAGRRRCTKIETDTLRCLETNADMKGQTVKLVFTPVQMWMHSCLKLHRHTVQACTEEYKGHAEVFMKGSVYLMIESTPTQPPSLWTGSVGR